MTDTTETKQKLCLLCRNASGRAHDEGSMFQDFHETNGYLWQPTKGHKDYQLHIRMIKLL